MLNNPRPQGTNNPHRESILILFAERGTDRIYLAAHFDRATIT